MAQRYDANGNPISDGTPSATTDAESAGAVTRYDANGNPMTTPPTIEAARTETTRNSPGYAEAYQRESNMRSGTSSHPRHTNPVASFLLDEPTEGPLAAVNNSLKAWNGPSGLGGWIDQMFANLGVQDEINGAGSYVAQGASNLVRQAQGKPITITASEAGQAASDFERARAERYTREHPWLNALSVGAGIASGGPATGPTGPVSALRQAMVSGALDAPFAVARQDGSLPERAQRALPEIGVSTLLGGALQGLANRLTRGGTPAAAARVAQFDQAGVRPTLAAVQGGITGGITKNIGENWIAGGRVRQALQNSIDDTAASAENIAHGYAAPQPRELAGESVQEGVRRFAQDAEPNPLPGAPAATPTRQWSFAGRANAQYDDVFSELAREERSYIDDGVAVPITTAQTEQALHDIMMRVSAPNVREIVNDPLFARISNALGQDRGALMFNDLRALRTWVREAQANPELRQNIGSASLQRLEGALTNDIYASAAAIGHGTNLAHQLRRADQYYAAGMGRIQNALKPFDPTRGVTPAQAYDHILSMASDRSGANTAALLSLKRTLDPEEWRTVAATIIDRMGRPAPGAPGAGRPDAFSVQRFATSFNNLSPEGRAVLFGSHGGGTAADDHLMAALDNLAQVADMQRAVERMANHSNSGVSIQNVGTIGTLANPGTTAWALAGLGGMMITGEMLTNPAFVRWIAGAPMAGAAGRWAGHVAALARLAARDPSLGQFYTQVAGAPPPPPEADLPIATNPQPEPVQ